ncbi:hypothetical protein PoB_007482800 [Plakobranchus ocellatus]|uniref:Uncharacterized protein n=1 Tax=Plakobranchus ocellatus TaxID=259542 RepID=A0AAV4DW66_9GAST|nr:hypothetical protein PoB_007482800 [Plakobranchus ocellatus]
MVLTRVCGTLSLQKLDVGERDTAASSVTSPIVAVQSIERIATADGRNNFTILFENNTQNLKILIENTGAPPTEPESVFEESDGVWVTSFLAQNLGSLLAIVFANEDAYHTMAFVLDNGGSDPKSQNVIIYPYLEVSPANEAVYNTSEDLEISVLARTYVQSNPNNSTYFVPQSELQTSFYQIKEEAGKWGLSKNEEILDRGSQKQTLNTSSHNVSGVFTLYQYAYGTGGSLAAFYWETMHVRVRPSTQSSTFPIVTVTKEIESLVSSGNSHTCSIGDTCIFRCRAFGENVTRMEINEILANGTQTAVPSAQRYPYQPPHTQHIYWLFEAQDDSGDANGITKFTCSAIDDTHGTRVTEEMEVQTTLTPYIVKDKSCVQIEDDQNNVGMKKVTFICTVRGRPLPTVYITGGDCVIFQSLDSEPLQVTSMGKVEALSYKVIIVDTNSLLESINTINAGRARAPFCKFSNLANFKKGQHVFDFQKL